MHGPREVPKGEVLGCDLRVEASVRGLQDKDRVGSPGPGMEPTTHTASFSLCPPNPPPPLFLHCPLLTCSLLFQCSSPSKPSPPLSSTPRPLFTPPPSGGV